MSDDVEPIDKQNAFSEEQALYIMHRACSGHTNLTPVSAALMMLKYIYVYDMSAFAKNPEYYCDKIREALLGALMEDAQ